MPSRKVDSRAVTGLLVITALLVILWDHWLMRPLRLLVVFFHEASHALMAIATGGQVVAITITPNEAGHCLTQGGHVFLITSAGYLGSVVWGALILWAAAKTTRPRWITGVLGVLLIVLAVWWVRPAFGFALPWSVLMGSGLLFLAYRFPRIGHRWILWFIGLTSCFYALFDIRDDILRRPGMRSDAFFLGEMTNIPGIVWGVLWFVIALVVTASMVTHIAATGIAETRAPERREGEQPS